MSNRLGGRQGTAYLGTNADQPPNWHFNDRSPNQYDTQNVSLGDLWLNKDDGSAWILTSLDGDSNSRGMLATWIRFAGSHNNLQTLTGDLGDVVPADDGGNITITGDESGLNLVGDAASHTLSLAWPTQPEDVEVLVGVTGGIPEFLPITSTGGTITVTQSPTALNFEAVAGTPSITTLTGTSGGAVGPDMAGNIDILGSGPVAVAGNPGTNTLTISVAAATDTTEGIVELATNAETIAGTDTTRATTPDDIKAKLGLQTNHTVALGATDSAAINWSNAGTDGQVLIGATGADPAFASITSLDGSITITSGANSLDIATTASSGASVSWTPVLSFGGGTTGITYSTQTGSYVKIGNLLTFSLSIVLTNKGSSTGNALIDGFPFSVDSSLGAFFLLTTVDVTPLANGTNMWAAYTPGPSLLLAQQRTSGSSGNLTDAQFSNTSSLQITGSCVVL